MNVLPGNPTTRVTLLHGVKHNHICRHSAIAVTVTSLLLIIITGTAPPFTLHTRAVLWVGFSLIDIWYDGFYLVFFRLRTFLYRVKWIFIYAWVRLCGCAEWHLASGQVVRPSNISSLTVWNVATSPTLTINNQTGVHCRVGGQLRLRFNIG